MAYQAPRPGQFLLVLHDFTLVVSLSRPLPSPWTDLWVPLSFYGTSCVVLLHLVFLPFVPVTRTMVSGESRAPLGPLDTPGDWR